MLQTVPIRKHQVGIRHGRTIEDDERVAQLMIVAFADHDRAGRVVADDRATLL